MKKLWLSLLCASLLMGVAFAQSSDAPSATKKPSKAELAEAKKRFGEAEAAYRLQEWQQALDGFKDAYRLSLKPELLFNVAQCYRNMERYEEAIQSYQAFLHDAPDSDYSKDAEDKIAEIEALLQKQEDDVEAAKLAKLQEAENARIAKEREEAAARRSSKSRTLFFAAGGVGALSLGGGAFTLLSLRKLEKDSVGVIDAEASQDKLRTLKITGAISDGLFGVALLTTAGALWVSHNNKKKPEVVTTLTLTPVGLSLSGSF